MLSGGVRRSSRPRCVAGRHRRVVAVRVLDGRDARARRVRRAAARRRCRRARRSRAGALAGGVITFGGARRCSASALGAAGGRGRVAAAIALAAALGEARGRADRPAGPPPGARSRGGACMPVPLAAGLYGVLLGLGFTTFILSLRRVGARRRSASRSATRRSALLIGLGVRRRPRAAR